MAQPTYSHKKSMEALLKKLEDKYHWAVVGRIEIVPGTGEVVAQVVPVWTKQDTMDVINAGVETTYKKKEKPGSRISNSSTSLAVLRKSMKEE